MARIHVNHHCNVCTGDDTKGYISPTREPRPEITVPSLRLRLSIQEARELALHLTEAVVVATQQEQSLGETK
jgi:hypothetical protein